MSWHPPPPRPNTAAEISPTLQQVHVELQSAVANGDTARALDCVHNLNVLVQMQSANAARAD